MDNIFLNHHEEIEFTNSGNFYIKPQEPLNFTTEELSTGDCFFTDLGLVSSPFLENHDLSPAEESHLNSLLHPEEEVVLDLAQSVGQDLTESVHGNTSDCGLDLENTKEEAKKSASSPKPQGPYYGNHTNSRTKMHKAKHATRRDVIYKNLLRAIRTTLLSEFQQFCEGTPVLKQTKGIQEKVIQFYQSRLDLQKYISLVFGEGTQGQEYFLEVLSMFLDEYSHYPHKTEGLKDVNKLLKKCVKSFTIDSYTKLFKSRSIQLLFTVLAKSGFTDKIISERPNFALNKERYQQAVESVMDFSTCSSLMK